MPKHSSNKPAPSALPGGHKAVLGSALPRGTFLLHVSLSVLYFFSGTAGLLYEVAWFRRLQLVFGVSAFAIGAVVSAFMLGLALGSRWAASAPFVNRRPLLAYSLQEMAIAGYALVFPALVVFVESVYSSLFPAVGGHFLTLSAVRLALGLLLLLPATFCMGATLPTLARVLVSSGAMAPRSTGWLYAVNTLGGVVGTLAAGFFTLEHFGIRGTLELAAALNVAIACAAFGLSLRAGNGTGSEFAPKRIEKSRLAAGSSDGAQLAAFVVAVTGFVSMALEVVWTRALVFYVHNSTYAFSAILAVYLVGLAAGAGLGARLSTRPKALELSGWALVACCLSTLLAMLIYRNLPSVMRPFLGESLNPELAGLPDRSYWIVRSWTTALGAIFLETGTVLFVPAFVFGMIFPLGLRLAQDPNSDWQRVVGRLYAWNTLGAVLGSMLGAFVLVALLGTQTTLVLLAWVPVPLGLWLLHRASGALKPRWWKAGLLMAGLAAATVVAAPAGFYRALFERRFGPVLWFSEGAAETVAVCQHQDGSAWIHYSDGRGASGTTSYRGGWLYAHVPLLLHPEPHAALVICFGTGNTLGAARMHPLDRVDGVELSREVVKASSFFKESNHGVAENPAVRIVIEDGRNYLLGTDARYDVITEEPPLVHTAGVVNLYSKDFYRLCRQKMTENGIMAVWLATWELEEREVKMLTRAFVDVFPYASIWDSKHLGEWILIGSGQPLSLDPANLLRRMSEPALARDLAKLGIRDPADLLALYMKGTEFLQDFSHSVRPVTDDRTVVDYTTPRQARANFGLGEFLTGGINLSGVSPAGLVSELRVREFDAVYTSREPPDHLLAGTARAQLESLLRETARRRSVAEAEAGRKLAWNVMATASDYQVLGQTDRSLEILKWGIHIVGRVASADLLVTQAGIYEQSGRIQDARQALADALAIEPKHAKGLKLAGRLLR